jgi:glutaredoxin
MRFDGMKATIYTTNNCPFCRKAKVLLDALAITYIEKTILSRQDETRVELAEKMRLKEGERLFVPQIWIDDDYIGGYDKLEEWQQTL